MTFASTVTRVERRGDESPRLIEALALVPAARREDGLRAHHAPAHPALFQPLRDQRLARRLDDTGADHEAYRGLSPHAP